MKESGFSMSSGRNLMRSNFPDARVDNSNGVLVSSSFMEGEGLNVYF